MVSTHGIGGLLAGVVLGVTMAGPLHAADPNPQPAAWMEHTVLVNLQDLPKTYSCYDLWYRFREVLEKIGARADLKITTQSCFFSGSAPAPSPHVEAHFYLPEALKPAQARYADVQAVPRTVILQASTDAHSLDKSDCVLLSQIKDKLLPALPVQVTDAHLDCSAPDSHKHGYRVSVQTLQAVPEPGH
jgi:hypothetical protein